MIDRVIAWSIRNRVLVILLWTLAAVWGIWCLVRTPIDAIPDLSENQVIVYTDWPGRSPREVEDQVTYPLSVHLSGLAGVKAVRAASDFGFAMVNVIFDEGVDVYFARERVIERLPVASAVLPPGVVPQLAPDATALGQIFWYTVEGEGQDLGELRAIQDYYVRYQLQSVPGVAEVASVGGFVREYQIDVDPQALRAHGVSIAQVYGAVAASNAAVGGKVIHVGGSEYLIRGDGWFRTTDDIETVVVRAHEGFAVHVGDVATVQLGPAHRRSVLEKAGSEAVGGVVLMRYGENPAEVTGRLKERIRAITPGLPPGVRVVPFYERTDLIDRSIGTLREALAEEMIVVSLVVLVVLLHVRSALACIVALPLAVLLSFVWMRLLGIPSNIMSLSGIAISIGVLTDAAGVTIENTYRALTDGAPPGPVVVSGDTRGVATVACQKVGRPIFFSILILLISFLPVFALSGMEGRMFRPLAFTKTFAMFSMALIAVTLMPALASLLVRGVLRREEDNPVVRWFVGAYRPLLAGALRHRRTTIVLTAMAVAYAGTLIPGIGREFMPPLDEGTILDMPVTVPSVNVTQVAGDLRARDALIAAFPEVSGVVGKAGRAETATDPSPIDMVETMVNLHPRARWPRRHLAFETVVAWTRDAVALLREQGMLDGAAPEAAIRHAVEAASMEAAGAFDLALRAQARRRIDEFQPRLAEDLARLIAGRLIERFEERGHLRAPVTGEERAGLAAAVGAVEREALLRRVDLAAVAAAGGRVAEGLQAMGRLRLAAAEAVRVPPGVFDGALSPLRRLLGRSRPATLFEGILGDVQGRAGTRWLAHTRQVDLELDDIAADVLAVAVHSALEGQVAAAGLGTGAGTGEGTEVALDALRQALRERETSHLALRPKAREDLVHELDTAVRVPGWANIWTQPIINRVDMLATGIRTTVGVKVFGDDPEVLAGIARDVAEVLKGVRGAVDVFPDQVTGEQYIEITPDRRAAARFGLTVGDIHDLIEVALGGRVVTWTVEGRRRFPVRVRYPREQRESVERIERLLVATAGGAQVPLADVAAVRIVRGPSMIRSENGLLVAYVQLNVRDRDVVGFVEEARGVVDAKVTLPPGCFLAWSGQFEHQERAWDRLSLIFPAAILAILVILYLTYESIGDALLILLAVPAAFVGGVVFQVILGQNFSVAVWVGYLVVFGLATETGIVMLIFLRDAIAVRGGLEGMADEGGIAEAVMEGAVQRLRPKLLTEATTVIGLVPMLWATGTGAEIMRPLAGPVLGGVVTSDLVILVVLPVLYHALARRRWRRLRGAADLASRGDAE